MARKKVKKEAPDYGPGIPGMVRFLRDTKGSTFAIRTRKTSDNTLRPEPYYIRAKTLKKATVKLLQMSDLLGITRGDYELADSRELTLEEDIARELEIERATGRNS